MSSQVIEVSEKPPIFNKDDWIGRGRKYQFRAILSQPLPVLRFDHFPPTVFLCALKHAPEVTLTGLKLSSDDWKMWKSRTIVGRFFRLSPERRSLTEDEE